MFERLPNQRLVALVVSLLVALASWRVYRARHVSPAFGVASDISGHLVQQLAGQLQALEAREKQVAETVWAKELLAEECGRVFEQLWDSLNAASNKLDLLAAFPVGELVPPRFGPLEVLPHGIGRYAAWGGAPAWSEREWRSFVAETQRAGWGLAQTELRHNAFDTDAAGRPRQSVIHCRAHFAKYAPAERAVLEGDLVVEWAGERSLEGWPKVRGIDASRLGLTTRGGEPAFRQVLYERIRPPEKSFFIDPLMLYDLDGDGLSEIILASSNVVFHRRRDGGFERQPFCRHSAGLIFTGVIADFDGDGVADFLGARFEGLVLFKGSPRGTFDEPGRLVWAADPRLKYGQALTGGDIDQDGDLDVWLGQYKNPYERGQMPTPYYNANDGNPAYLLLNDGYGNFTDATEQAGLGKKRWRRSYSGSFVDLDGDGSLDLMVVSDFAGLDLYANDGRGHFRDVSSQWIPDVHGFGMAHTLADFNADGQLDFLVMGMHCPTALRLQHLGLVRSEHPDYAAMIPEMTAGNRLYLGQSPGANAAAQQGGSAGSAETRFRRSSLNDSIAHSGWSWGCSAFDFDNDGYPDVYIGNGHETRQSVQDYEPEFWLHDLYVGTSKDDVVVNGYFGGKFLRTRGRGQSYGGYEKNRLYLNQAGVRFIEIGHLMDVALEQDCRNAASDDLDGDGRMDLVVTSFEVWPEAKQSLRVFQNALATGGNWIGFRLKEEGRGVSPVGARITLRYAGRAAVRQIVTGDSHRTQHANTMHFGLGKVEQVDSAEIRWVNGRSIQLERPALNQYHLVHLPQ